MQRTIMTTLALLSLAACNNGGGGMGDAGPPHLAGTWHRTGDSTSADVTLTMVGPDTGGTASWVAVSANQNNDPPCTQTFRYSGTYATTGTMLTFTAMAGTAMVGTAGCTDPTNNQPTAGGALVDMAATSQAMMASGTYTVSATQLVITTGGSSFTLTRM
jgi:hypothetical protein